MKNRIALFAALALFYIAGNSQSNVQAWLYGNQYEKGDTVIIKLDLDTITGSIQWESSPDAQNWQLIQGETSDSLVIIADTQSYFRAEVTYANCNPNYSDIVSLSVYSIDSSVLIADSTNLNLISDSAQLAQGIYQFQLNNPINLDTGEFIISQHGQGYMRKVIGKTQVGNVITLQTEQASLDEVVGDLSIEDSVQILINSSSMAKIGGAPVGVNVRYVHPGVTMNAKGDGLILDNTVLFDDTIFIVNNAGDTILSPTLKATITHGQFVFDPIFNRKLKLSIWDTVTDLSLTTGGIMDFDCDLELECDLPLSYSDSIPIFVADIGPIMLGPVPMYINLDFYAGFEANLDDTGTVSTGFDATASVEVGAQYVKKNNPRWSSIWDVSGNFNKHPLVWSATADASARAYVQARVSTTIASVAGPYMEAIPYLRLNGGVAMPDSNWYYEMTGGADAKIGFWVQIFGKTLADYQANLASWEYVFFSDSGTLSNPPPIALFSVSDSIAGIGDTVSFMDQSLNNPTSWHWDFGDGDTSNLQNPSHIYQNAGTYMVHLQVENPGGADSVMAVIDIECTPKPDQANAGPDMLNIVGDSVQLAGNVPTVGSGQWATSTGSVTGTFSDSTAANSWFFGATGDTFELVWTISNPCGSSSDTVLVGFAPDTSSFTCGDSLLDSRDGQSYATVPIGTQCWMAENLNVGVMVNSVNTGSSHSDVSNNGIIEKYCYDNTTSNCDEYGGLYDWDEAMGYSTTEGVQGVCPADWHIPTDAEWDILVNYLGGSSFAGGKMKEVGTTHWGSPNTGATNSSGFTGLPGGNRISHGSFTSLYLNGSFWSSSVNSSISTWSRLLANILPVVFRSNPSRPGGHSVRCVWDSLVCSPQPDQANAGPDMLIIVGDSAQLAGNVPSVGSGQWTVASAPLGNPGVFSDSTAADSWYYSATGDTFELVWTISNPCGSSSDTVLIVFVSQQGSFTCGSILVDSRDNQQYATVQIGTQCWMAENLNVGVMVNSVNTGSSHSDVSNNGIIEKYCYDNSGSNCDEYGGLYDWDEAMGYITTEGVQGVCPANWHIPTDAEWDILVNYLGLYIAGAKMKEVGTTHWVSPNTGANNSSGFTGLPGGDRFYIGDFTLSGYNGNFWSSSVSSSSYAWSLGLHHNSQYVTRGIYSRKLGFSVRCLRD